MWSFPLTAATSRADKSCTLSGHRTLLYFLPAADITEVKLKPGAYEVWHDRAVFHFLTASEQRAAYVRQVGHAVNPGGRVARCCSL
jgi:hypothetical protein